MLMHDISSCQTINYTANTMKDHYDERQPIIVELSSDNCIQISLFYFVLLFLVVPPPPQVLKIFKLDKLSHVVNKF